MYCYNIIIILLLIITDVILIILLLLLLFIIIIIIGMRTCKMFPWFCLIFLKVYLQSEQVYHVSPPI